MNIEYYPLTPEFFSAVIALGDRIHGNNYLDQESLATLYRSGIVNDINSSFVAVNTAAAITEEDTSLSTSKGLLVGFRITISASHFNIDDTCTPDKWGVPSDKVAYFKSNTVDNRFQGNGIGSQLLKHSIKQLKRQGATAGLAHIWLQSPGNSAFKYFTKCGGQLIQKHENKWLPLSLKDGYYCPVCDGDCYCTAGEMLLVFENE